MTSQSSLDILLDADISVTGCTLDAELLPPVWKVETPQQYGWELQE